MVDTGSHEVNLDSVRDLYSQDAAARVILDHFASRERNWRLTTVDRLRENVLKGGTDVSRAQVIQVLKRLEQLGCGTFRAGRKGYPSRFEWNVQMVGLGQAAAGERTEVEPVNPEDDLEEDAGPELIEHRFQLRKQLAVDFALPNDLSKAEAARLADFIKTLPFE